MLGVRTSPSALSAKREQNDALSAHSRKSTCKIFTLAIVRASRSMRTGTSALPASRLRNPLANFFTLTIVRASRSMRMGTSALPATRRMNSIKAALQKELRDAGWHSRGYLPHFDDGEIAQTITFRLADSVPGTVLKRWMQELEDSQNSDRVLRKRIEHYLDQGYGSCALRDIGVATMVQDSLLYFDNERYRLSSWVVMPNHAHLLLSPFPSWSISRIIKDMKSFTSREANKLLGRRGQFWMEDYFDRYVRNYEHFKNAIRYIENNPVKAKLRVRPEDWPFSSAWFRARGKVLGARTSPSAFSAKRERLSILSTQPKSGP